MVKVRFAGYGTDANNAQSLGGVFIAHRPFPHLPDWWEEDVSVTRFAAFGFPVDQTDHFTFPAEEGVDYHFSVWMFSDGALLHGGGESELLLELTVEVVVPEIFQDGFESGDASTWSVH
jgi:hypothetical protein